MNFNRLINQRVVARAVRFMSNEVVKAAEAPKTVAAPIKPAAPAAPTNQSTFFQRLTSFFTGCGVGFGLSYYFIHEALEESNAKLEQQIQALLAKK